VGATVVAYRVSGVPVGPSAWLAAAPVLFVVAAALALGAGLVVAALSTRYRDLAHFTSQGIFLLMYASTVLIPLSAVPARYRWMILANPITPVLEGLRAGILGRGTVEWAHLAYSGSMAALLLAVGVLLFSRAQRTSMDTV
jgi:lipopolysaccharide transport system permease protein